MRESRIIRVGHVDAFRAELQAEQWTRVGGTPEEWRHDANRIWLTGCGFHAYEGEADEYPPSDGIDLLEPSDCGPVEQSRDTLDHGLTMRMLHDRVFLAMSEPWPAPERVHADDLDRFDTHMRDVRDAALEMTRLGDDPARWKRLMKRLDAQRLQLEAEQRGENIAMWRVFQILAVIGVTAGVIQTIIAIAALPWYGIVGSIIASAVMTILGIRIAFRSRP